jgi:4-hydroxybenzoate polyprenyltransferase
MLDSTTTTRPLVVDLDGTLSRVDTLHEAFVNACILKPFRVPGVLLALGSGKGAMKSALAKVAEPKVQTLPLREEVVELIREAKERHRFLVLATGAHESIASGMADRLGCFDEVVATRGNGPNMVGEAKARTLVERFGEGGFDYVGDSSTDVPVWRRCGTGYVVGSEKRASGLSNACGKLLVRLPTRKFGRAPWKILRPHQWIKNLLVFLPLLAAHQIMEFDRLSAALLLFSAFCVAASTVYLANDLFDRDSDRKNPSKATRPLASGRLRLPSAIGLGSLLVLVLGSICTRLPWQASAAIGVYLAANAAYTIHIKRRLLADIFLLTFMYVWRIVAGGLATGIVSSVWLLGFSSFVFLSLAFAKRYAEVIRMDGAENDRAAGRAWKPVDAIPLATIGMGCGVGGSIMLALFVTGSSFAKLYRNESVALLLSPLFLYWITRIWIQASRRELHEDPVLFAAKDKISYLVVLVAVGILGAAMF